MSVLEDKVPGEEVGRLIAKDPDLGDNGLVNYRLIDGDGMDVFELTTDSESREAVIKLKKVRRIKGALANMFGPVNPVVQYYCLSSRGQKYFHTHPKLKYNREHDNMYVFLICTKQFMNCCHLVT